MRKGYIITTPGREGYGFIYPADHNVRRAIGEKDLFFHLDDGLFPPEVDTVKLDLPAKTEVLYILKRDSKGKLKAWRWTLPQFYELLQAFFDENGGEDLRGF